MEAAARLGAAGIDGDGMVAGGRTRRGTGCPRRLGASPADCFGQEGHGGEAELWGGWPELGEARNVGGGDLLRARLGFRVRLV
jgi:hypothetical protein